MFKYSVFYIEISCFQNLNPQSFEAYYIISGNIVLGFLSKAWSYHAICELRYTNLS